jgi:hypothetical protein
MDTTKIHGLIDPPLGYEWLPKGAPLTMESKFLYGGDEWHPVGSAHAPHPNFLYCRPLDDGYEYFPKETIIQPGDEECSCDGRSRPHSPSSYGKPGVSPLRRTKAKPSPLAKGRNVNGLTESQVETHLGWRLITDVELNKLPNDAEYYNKAAKWDISAYQNDSPGLTDKRDTDYRTKAPLPTFNPCCVFTYPGTGCTYTLSRHLSPSNTNLIVELIEALSE